MKTKICSKCKQTKSLSEFRKRPDRHKENAACLVCERKKCTEYYHSPKGQAAKQRSYQKVRDTESWRNNRLKTNYNLTVEQHQQMYLDQNGCCFICKTPIPYNKVSTDHNHKTGEVRKLLCNTCNVFVGYIEKYSYLLPVVLNYIK